MHIFRGSITRLPHSLSTLRSFPSRPQAVVQPRKTRFRLVANLCRVGLVTHWVPSRGFRFWVYMTSSSPRLCLAH